MTTTYEVYLKNDDDEAVLLLETTDHDSALEYVKHLDTYKDVAKEVDADTLGEIVKDNQFISIVVYGIENPWLTNYEVYSKEIQVF